jgi:hypothetical protein
LAPSGRTRRLHKISSRGLSGRSKRIAYLWLLNSSLPRSHFGTSRFDPAFSQKLGPRPTRPSSTNFLSRVIQKFLAKVSVWHFSVRPGVPSKARAKAYSSLKYDLPISSHSKVSYRGLYWALFGPTRCFLRSSCQGPARPRIGTS